MTDSRITTTETLHSSHCHHHYPHCFSWSAVLVGALVMVGLSFLLNLLSLAVGFTAFNVSEGNKTEFVTAGFIGLTVITIIVMFLGGYIAGALGKANCGKRRLGELYGFTAWCLALVIGVMLASGVGRFVANYDYVISQKMPPIDVTAKEITGQPSDASGSTEDKAKTLGSATFVTFFLFGIGALSASFGGYIGMKRRKRDEIETETTVVDRR